MNLNLNKTSSIGLTEPDSSAVQTKLIDGKTGKRFSKSFLQRADAACFWESYVSAVLARNGLYVLHEPMHLGEFHDPLKSTTSDIHVGPTADLALQWDVEIKSRNLYWTCPEDYPFDSVRVCSQSWFLKNWPGYDTTGRDFLFVSQKTGGIVWLPMGSKVTLGEEVVDHERNELYKCVTAHIDQLMSLEQFVAEVRQSGLDPTT